VVLIATLLSMGRKMSCGTPAAEVTGRTGYGI